MGQYSQARTHTYTYKNIYVYTIIPNKPKSHDAKKMFATSRCLTNLFKLEVITFQQQKLRKKICEICEKICHENLTHVSPSTTAQKVFLEWESRRRPTSTVLKPTPRGWSTVQANGHPSLRWDGNWTNWIVTSAKRWKKIHGSCRKWSWYGCFQK